MIHSGKINASGGLLGEGGMSDEIKTSRQIAPSQIQSSVFKVQRVKEISMAVMKELSLGKEELLDNVQKFVLCGRAMLDAIEEISTQFAQLANGVPAKPATERANAIRWRNN